MTMLEYQVRFFREDLARSIVEALERKLPNSSFEERYRLADEAINNIKKLANRGVYLALVGSCVDSIMLHRK